MQMSIFEKSVWLPADLAEVFSFHRNPANLKVVQPPGAQVLDAQFPDQLTLGSTCEMTVQVPFGRQHWKIEVKELSLDASGSYAVMVDQALHSPFAYWEHHHQFSQEKQGTLMKDKVVFQPPGGWFSVFLRWPAYLMLQVLFMYRHRQTFHYFAKVRAAQS